MDWAKAHAVELGSANPTDLVQSLLEAVREGRVHIRPRSGVNAFPADEVRVGSTPGLPALITPGCPVPRTLTNPAAEIPAGEVGLCQLDSTPDPASGSSTKARSPS